GTVTTMFFLGRLSDQIGRCPVVLSSLGIAAASAVTFLFADATTWLFPARILSGLAIALTSGASTAWIVELQTQKIQRSRHKLRLAPTCWDLALAHSSRACLPSMHNGRFGFATLFSF